MMREPMGSGQEKNLGIRIFPGRNPGGCRLLISFAPIPAPERDHPPAARSVGFPGRSAARGGRATPIGDRWGEQSWSSVGRRPSPETVAVGRVARRVRSVGDRREVSKKPCGRGGRLRSLGGSLGPEGG